MFQGPGYEVTVPDESTARSVVVTANVGVAWDDLTEQRICQGFFPPNPTFESQSNGSYLYTTDEGEIEYMPLPDTCEMAFTGKS